MAKKDTTTKEEPLENQLWKAADKLRKNIDAAEYKHIVLGLIFLKYVSDAFEELYAKLKKDEANGADPEDKDEYRAENVFFVPQDARWSILQAQAKQPQIGKFVDDAMDAIEKENNSLKGVLPKVYARQNLDPASLGGLIDLVGNVALGSAKARSADVLGHVFEYFLGEFALAEGKKGGQFYTPRSVVELLIEILEPYKGRVFDPCCGSGGMFVQSAHFVEHHRGNINNMAVYGQDSNPTTWKMAQMNLAIHGIEADLGKYNADTFFNDCHPTLKADFIMANPPFNLSDWGADKLADDVRWKYGLPPSGNANFAWIQHMIHHLSPNGKIGLVLANGSLSSQSGGEGDIRRRIVEDDLVEGIIAMPTQLFYTTQIPVSLWFINRNKKQKTKTLFIDARKMGTMVSRKNREMTAEDIVKIAAAFEAFENGTLEDLKGFCAAVTTETIAKQDFILTPGRYVGIEEQEEDGEPFDEKMKRLTGELSEMFERSHELEDEIRKRLRAIGYEI